MLASSESDFREHLVKTVAWCTSRVNKADPKRCLRSHELQQVVERYDTDVHDLWVSSEMAEAVISKRNQLAGDSPSKGIIQGRILGFSAGIYNHNGLSAWSQTTIYHDNPPWDTWICTGCQNAQENAEYVGLASQHP